MLRVEFAEKIIEYLGFNRSMIHKAIESNVLEIVQTDGLTSEYRYCITGSSFEKFLYNFNLSDREIDSIMASF